ncbi:MAG TPA: SOUL heme-binding protein [Cryomorphaceae bacterium]|jgi:hypothetical protein|nr:MAG: hypothetical protein ABR98_00285 [Cryomorphaceae bacterium BACL7 MAG-120910-bin2]KRO68193.1 MAG: hypothetical protein ABR88_02705 [Cryomorphaceae bacterium BACL7 MAG-120322-bin74]KRO82248.1 MAG: hypothetical protein ABR87_02815 [Cryomorphaceae bacterium BACL7 MAG-121220-bin83]NQW26146.1 heme-binding protein [Cryomorphaceae bacterium]HAB32436.1 SOUL heme-binding protein [Cryomorphaceae bacterium]|tara:strand:- start:1031 stop:1609 length:579 start_codon:yes stop_codon:yes gene_type:complete
MNWVLASICILALGFWGFTYHQSKKLEQPTYTVLASEHDFELREYAPSLWAEVQVDEANYSAMRKGFQPLARYIFGGNQSQTSMEMTAPVSLIMEESAPTMRFFMSAKMTVDKLPLPNDARVHFVEEPSRRLAVYRFGGILSEDKRLAAGQKLKQWCDAQGYDITGPVEVYGYNAPYEIIRRNEVAYPIASN